MPLCIKIYLRYFLFKCQPVVGKVDFISHNFDVDSAVSVDAVTKAAIVAAFDSTFNKKILYNQDMENLERNFENYI